MSDPGLTFALSGMSNENPARKFRSRMAVWTCSTCEMDCPMNVTDCPMCGTLRGKRTRSDRRHDVTDTERVWGAVPYGLPNSHPLMQSDD